MAALKVVGRSGQVSLGKQLSGHSFVVNYLPNGSILFEPAKITTKVPKQELWVNSPAMKKRLAASAAWMEKNPPRDTDLDALSKKLGVK